MVSLEAKMLLSWFFVIVTIELSSSLTVKRAFFQGSYPKTTLRVLAEPDFFDQMKRWFRGVNYTLLRAEHEKPRDIGYLLSNGSYNGYIGFLQRNDYDFVEPNTVLGSLVDEPILHGPAAAPFDIVVLSGKPKAMRKRVDEVVILGNVDHETRLFMVCCLVIVACVMAYSFSFRKSFYTFDLPRQILVFVQTMFFAIVRQDKSKLSRSSSRVLWFAFSISIFFVLFGYVCNMMSTDLVVEVKRPVIDSLEDFMSPRFEHVTPMIMGTYTAHTYLQQAKPDSLAGKFYRRLLSNPKERLMSVSPSDAGKLINKLRDGCLAGNISLAISTVTYDSLGEYVLCHFNHTIVENLHRSKGGTFGQGVATKMMSKFIVSELRWFLDYRLTVMFEAGLVHAEFIKFRRDTLDKLIETTWDTIKCLNHVNIATDAFVESLTLRGLFRAILISCWGILTAFAIIFLELIHSMLSCRHQNVWE